MALYSNGSNDFLLEAEYTRPTDQEEMVVLRKQSLSPAPTATSLPYRVITKKTFEARYVPKPPQDNTLLDYIGED